MKRILLVLLICLAIPVSSFSAVAHVQSVVGDWSTGSTWKGTITVTTAGDLLIASIQMWANNSSNTVGAGQISDPSNGTWLDIDSSEGTTSGQNAILRTAYVKSTVGGTFDVTVAANSSVIDRARIIIHEVSGADTTTPLDQHTIQALVAPGAGTDAITSGAVTTTANGEYIFGASLTAIAFDTVAHGTNFTDGVINNYSASEYRTQTTAGSQAGTFTSGGGATYRIAVATFKAAAGTFKPYSLPLTGAGLQQ